MTNLKYDYSSFTDEELVTLSKSEDILATEILISRYMGFVKSKLSSYYIKGADKEDLIQEGLIGLFKGIRDYNLDKNIPFSIFAAICINRNIFTAIKTANREKHRISNESLSIYKQIYEDGDMEIIDLLPSVNSCEEKVLYREENKIFKSKMSEALSELELKAAIMHYEGFSYNEIANILDRNYKSIDAAINRAKVKMRKKLDIREFQMML